jgi:ABC-type Fe3+ transport system substrate-binding protein
LAPGKLAVLTEAESRGKDDRALAFESSGGLSRVNEGNSPEAQDTTKGRHPVWQCFPSVVPLNTPWVITHKVNAQKFPKVNAAGAKAFVEFMIAPETQKMIGDFGKDKFGQSLFFPDAGKQM